MNTGTFSATRSLHWDMDGLAGMLQPPERDQQAPGSEQSSVAWATFPLQHVDSPQDRQYKRESVWRSRNPNHGPLSAAMRATLLHLEAWCTWDFRIGGELTAHTQALPHAAIKTSSRFPQKQQQKYYTRTPTSTIGQGKGVFIYSTWSCIRNSTKKDLKPTRTNKRVWQGHGFRSTIKNHEQYISTNIKN